MIKIKYSNIILKSARGWVIAILDTFTVVASYFLALLIGEYQKNVDYSPIFLRAAYVLPLLVGLYFIGFYLCTSFRVIWRYANKLDYLLLLVGSIVPGLIFAAIDKYLINKINGFYYARPNVMYLLLILMVISISVTVRLFYAVIYLRNKQRTDLSNLKRTLIVGAGQTANLIVQELLKRRGEYNPICILDDNDLNVTRTLQGIRIIGCIQDLEKTIKEYNIKAVILAIPSIDEEKKKYILNTCVQNNCEIKIIPKINDIIQKSDILKQAKDVKIEDLLGRDSINFDYLDVANFLENKTVLVTGGGGTIGSELARQISTFKVKRLVLVDNYENGVYEIQQELLRKNKDLNLNVEIVTVTDRDRMDKLFNTYKFNVVFHAAAHKHVPLMEINPESAVKNNIVGTQVTVDLSSKYNVEKFVLISSDKAVNPTNFMGATKRLCEMIIQKEAQKNTKTKFTAVRFGNVLGSNGSVIPLFKRQILEGGPVTVTDKNIIRYFMTIKEAVSLILETSTFAKNGEIFILDMGEPVKILNLAENMIRLMGYKPYEDIQIVFTGLRPGEKLYEELLKTEEGLTKTQNGKIFVVKQVPIDNQKLEKDLKQLIEVAFKNEPEKVVEKMQDTVPTYKPNRKTLTYSRGIYENKN